MNAKVYLGIVMHDSKRYIFSDFLSHLALLSYDDLVISCVDNSKANGFKKDMEDFQQLTGKKIEYEQMQIPEFAYEKLTEKRNITHTAAINRLFEKFLETDCTHFFCVEQDVLLPPNIIEHLLSFKKPIVGQWYNICENYHKIIPCIHKSGYAKQIPNGDVYSPWIVEFYKLSELTGRLMEVAGCGFGCLLMERDIIKNVPKIKHYKGLSGSVDCVFYVYLRSKKIPLYVDTSFKLRHVQGWIKEV